ncbi:Ribosomal protein S6 kinase beta-1 [Lobulomyces angularis]|nr:Ribosomal protein S6 kinase beta-1 [Lobulomyces angularis]
MESGNASEDEADSYEAIDEIFTLDVEEQVEDVAFKTTSPLRRNSSFKITVNSYNADETGFSLSNNATTTTPTLLKKSVGLKDFDFQYVIGKGAYGTTKIFKLLIPLLLLGKVFLVKKRNAQSYYAMKVLKKASLIVHQKDTEHTLNERNILEAVQHPFIVKLFYAFQTSFKLYLILGYAPGGELFTYLHECKMFSEDQVVFYASELVLALEHLHSLGIIYRDLKPENVLLGEDGHILLTDFGLSKVAVNGARTICGTAEFMAPEIINLDLYLENVKNNKAVPNEPPSYDAAIDFWGLGAMMFDMLTGSPPFTGGNNKKVMENILKKKLFIPNYLTPNSKDILNKLLKKHPKARLQDWKLLKNSNFFKKMNFKNLLAKQIHPPFLPTIQSLDDVSNFSKDFTSMSLNTPPESNTFCSCIATASEEDNVNLQLEKINNSEIDNKAINEKLNFISDKNDCSASNSISSPLNLHLKRCGKNCAVNHFNGFSFVNENFLVDSIVDHLHSDDDE